MFIELFSPKDILRVKDARVKTAKLLKRNVFGHMVLNVHSAENENLLDVVK
jgi:hypothetical protein